MKILYTSADVHVAIKDILREPAPNERRVVIVAFVGANAESFLPNPDGLEIVCCLRPGATSPLALGRLKNRKAKIYKSQHLHMKVYWSSRRGCVICSANASGNALGIAAQKEAGVLFKPNVVDIERLLDYANPKPIRDSDLKRLSELERKTFKSYATGPKEKLPDFLEWLTLPGRADWKLGWWDIDGKFSRVAVEKAEKAYGIKGPYDFINIKDGQLNHGDYVLTFRLPIKEKPDWMFVDYVVADDPSGKAYDKAYPTQAVQVNVPKMCPPFPFVINKPFYNSFKKAVEKFGIEKIQKLANLAPPKQLLDLIAKDMRPPSDSPSTKAHPADEMRF